MMKVGIIVTIGLTALCAMSKAQAEEHETVYLWPAKVEKYKGKSIEEISPRSHGNVTRISKILSPSITVYPASDASKAAPAVVVCPGGGYSILAIDKEGTEIAEWLNSIGITAFVLKYSVPKQKEAALQDVQRAMGVIRQHAKKWKIDSNKLGIIGFSAGGSLASRLCHSYEKRVYDQVDEADKLSCKPDFCMLIYPAWLEAAAGRGDYPPTFILQTKDDGLVKPTIPYAEALKHKKVPTEFHLVEKGGHGDGLRPSKHPVSKWPELAEKWLLGRKVIKPSTR